MTHHNVANTISAQATNRLVLVALAIKAGLNEHYQILMLNAPTDTRNPPPHSDPPLALVTMKSKKVECWGSIRSSLTYISWSAEAVFSSAYTSSFFRFSRHLCKNWYILLPFFIFTCGRIKHWWIYNWGWWDNSKIDASNSILALLHWNKL